MPALLGSVRESLKRLIGFEVVRPPINCYSLATLLRAPSFDQRIKLHCAPQGSGAYQGSVRMERGAPILRRTVAVLPQSADLPRFEECQIHPSRDRPKVIRGTHPLNCPALKLHLVQNRSDYYLGVNPLGLVPCLVHDGQVNIVTMFQSFRVVCANCRALH